MIARIVLPHIAANLPSATLGAWLVEEDQRVEFGQPICQVMVSARVLLRGTRWANSLLAFSKRSNRPVVAYEVERDRFEASYTIVASEGGVIQSHVASPGQALEVGDTLAIALLGDAAVDEQGPANLPLMRVVARLDPSEFQQ